MNVDEREDGDVAHQARAENEEGGADMDGKVAQASS